MRSGNPAIVTAFIFSIAIGWSFESVDAFRPSAVISQPSCRSNNNILCSTGLHTAAPRQVTTRRTISRLNAVDKDRTNVSLDGPGKFPTIEIDVPPPEDIYQQAISRTLLWVGLAVAFGVGLGFGFGQEVSEEFFAGYLVEQSLSVDNLFVFLLLFEYFKVPLSSQDRVLNWGIYGAVVMRAGMIGIGAVALERFHAILLVFAAILVYSSVQTLIPEGEDEEEDMGENAIVKFSRNLFDSTDEFDGSNFFTLVDGIKTATPLFICMIALEISDVVFAVDSIPAVFGVTENPLVVFSSNMFAIMGLRSLYTILSKAASDLEYLEPAVGIVLGFIGVKMIAEYFGTVIPTEYALAVVATLLSGGIGLSVYENGQEEGA
mmetsp:Transcript_352/g.686  ORF Transcript_352/g.686 Transcript_352/m.686 type:complete len:376 (-) Transcript_352:482-1609(-)|eukprot:CAMPEP_0201625312 /NCGR_PEP_ID=MMETSP0493-20130528/1156_1 /ASSEMBLY_ACC=CAM_ASM_000838 /TAXON_ID=420259 /ORGANISM="Thalassiosira gravida, Strain GMp14c1" /LENGTH=375 /DNA_ID=CAMNT_0048095277 /DNA_START=130 /DNA_END=1257 /DNA_ORIENTATION=-